MLLFFFKQKTAYEMRISDWSSDVCSSDLARRRCRLRSGRAGRRPWRLVDGQADLAAPDIHRHALRIQAHAHIAQARLRRDIGDGVDQVAVLRVLRRILDRLVDRDRKSVVYGKRVSVRVDLGSRRILKKKKQNHDYY